MKQHDFIPLVTFRGYTIKQNSKDKNDKQVFGYLEYGEKDGEEFFIIKKHYYAVGYQVCKDSLGIYTGKDDKNGTPIFCGVSGAKYGSDILKARTINNPINIEGFVINEDGEFLVEMEDNLFPLCTFNAIEYSSFEVIGNQYEQYLKDSK